MVATARRSIIRIKGSHYVNIPSGVATGKKGLWVLGSKIHILDSTGELPKEDLERFMDEVVEPAFVAWLAASRAPLEVAP